MIYRIEDPAGARSFHNTCNCLILVDLVKDVLIGLVMECDMDAKTFVRCDCEALPTADPEADMPMERGHYTNFTLIPDAAMEEGVREALEAHPDYVPYEGGC